jgi:hypothetical protein
MFRLLLVEDNEDHRAGYQVLIKEYEEDHPIRFKVFPAESLSAARLLIKTEGEFDGAIIDLKLRRDVAVDDGAAYEGNELIVELTEIARCPVIVFSANPMNISWEAKNRIFRTIDRGEGFTKAIELLDVINSSGISELMKKTGLIEGYLDKVYWNVLWDRRDTWLAYAATGKPTKDAMLRLVLNHLVEFIGLGSSEYFPDEAYLKVFNADILRTGQLYKNKANNEHFIMISPACDLVVHEDGPKSEFVQLCRIYCHNEEPIISYLRQAGEKLPEPKEPTFKEARIIKNRADAFLRDAPGNKKDCYHYLPKSDSTVFKGGVVNFREVGSFKRESFADNFSAIGIQVAPPFLKDIVSRFSSYYARQGQPVFDLDGRTGRALFE